MTVFDPDALRALVREEVEAALASERRSRDRRWIEATEAAELLGISRHGVYQRVRRGQLDAVRDGRRLYIEVASLPESVRP